MTFDGFSRSTTEFLAALEANNDRDWMKAHKAEFERSVMAPARAFVLAMGERLAELDPDINAIPRTDKSIFRFHRDTRFSKDKRPFKTHLGIFFWSGDGKKMESPGFYFHLEEDRLLLGGGMYCLTREQLPVYRAAVDHDKTGPALERILVAAAKEGLRGDPDAGDLSGMQHYKRVPRDYPADHPRGELLKLKGVTSGTAGPIPKALHTPEAIDHAFTHFARMKDLHDWLKKVFLV